MSEKVAEATKKCDEALKVLEENYKRWLRERRKAINDLEVIVTDMDSGEFKNNVAQIVGSSVGVASGAMMIGGLLLAPFTGGVSAAIGTGLAVGFGVAGGITNLTADQINQNYALSRCKDADDIIKSDLERSKNLGMAESHFLQAIQTSSDIAKSVGLDFFKAVSKIQQGRKAVRVIANTAKVIGKGGRGFSSLGMTAGKALGKAGAFALVGVGFDVWSIVSSSNDIAKGSKSELGKGVTKIIGEMKESMQKMQGEFFELYELSA